MKYYAVIRGRNVENKIFTSWNECKEVVQGFKGAKYKSFTSKQEAEAYLNTSNIATKKEDNKYRKDVLHAYVDGSYSQDLNRYGSGIAYVYRGVLFNMDSFSNPPSAESNSWQVEGELMACIRVMEECLKANIKDIVVFHDYEGVVAHAIGTWARNTHLSNAYHNLMQDYLKQINVQFVQVNSHTGDIFNEIADDLAKSPIHIRSTGAVKKYLENNKIKTMTKDLKKELEDLIDYKSVNIVPIDN